MTHESYAQDPNLAEDENDAVSIGRYRELNQPWRITMAVLTGISILLAIKQSFKIGFLMGDVMLNSR